MRVGYPAAGEALLDELRPLTPPRAVSLPAQLAAVRALENPAYYAGRYAETHALRAALAAGVRELSPAAGVECGVTNSILVRLPPGGPTAAALAARCRVRGLFIRDLGSNSGFAGRTVRLAVKDAATQTRMLAILAAALGD